MTVKESVRSRWPSHLGYALNWLLSLFVGMGGVMDLIRPPFVVEGVTKAGYDERILVPMGVVTLICVLLYAIPRTSVLGAILLTGYFGGAVATHVNQIGEPAAEGVYSSMAMAFTFGVLIWVALYLRMPALRRLAPVVR